MKVAFIEGRPHSHPTHSLYAKSVGAEFFFVDRIIRYHDDKKKSKLKALVSWFANAFFFPNKGKYDVFLTEEPYFSVVIMKKLGLISKKQKIISILGTHTLYFLHTKKFSKLTSLFIKYIFNSYDGIICEGTMQKELLNLYITNKNLKIYHIYNGNPTDRYEELLDNTPKLYNYNILTIAGMPNKERMYYKGIDLMISSFAKAIEKIPELTYTIVGDYDKVLIEEMLSIYPREIINKVKFIGLDYNLLKYIETSSLYLHIARGEAWGVSITESMLGGLPVIVSEWTGAKDIVNKVDRSYVLPLDINMISNKIVEYYRLPIKEKEDLSTRFKNESSKLTEARAVENFKKMFTLSIE